MDFIKSFFPTDHSSGDQPQVEIPTKGTTIIFIDFYNNKKKLYNCVNLRQSIFSKRLWGRVYDAANTVIVISSPTS